jgi:peptidoglycan/LPS O-acetylase OafA/YrhL
MTRQFSVVLDFVRFSAAMAVFLSHLALMTKLPLGIAAQFGHDAVIIFFVLSGYVIAYTVHERERDFQSYAISRLARLWSVVLPALLLTVCLNAIGLRIAPGHYHELPAPPIVASALFVNQLWFLNISPWSNGPFWSLGFEFWYYVFYACIAFLRGRMRILAATGTALVMGPKILLMLPIWLLGAHLYFRRKAPSETLGWLLIASSIALYLGYRWSAVSEPMSAAVLRMLGIPHSALGMAAYFVSDYMVAAMCAAVFVGLRGVEARIARIVLAASPPIRFLAGFTFSLYLFHVPLLIFCSSVLPRTSFVTPIVTLGVALLIGSISERRKHVVRDVFARGVVLASRVSTRLSSSIHP